jgi:hypothetical protein
MNRRGPLLLFAFSGVAAFVRASMEWGMLTAAGIIAAVLVFLLALMAYAGRRPQRVGVPAAPRRSTRVLAAIVPLVGEVLLVLGGPFFVVMGVVLVLHGFLLGIPIGLAGIWYGWSGLSSLQQRRGEPRRSRYWL